MMSLGKIYFLSIYSLFFEQPLYPQALGISFELKNKDKSPALEKESESEVAQLCPTLCDRMDCSPPGSSIHGVFQASILEWVALSFSRGIFPTHRSNPGLRHCRQSIYHLSHQGIQT